MSLRAWSNGFNEKRRRYDFSCKNLFSELHQPQQTGMQRLFLPRILSRPPANLIISLAAILRYLRFGRRLGKWAARDRISWRWNCNESVGQGRSRWEANIKALWWFRDLTSPPPSSDTNGGTKRPPRKCRPRKFCTPSFGAVSETRSAGTKLRPSRLPFVVVRGHYDWVIRRWDHASTTIV
jgi:hypothetical protein